MSDTSYVPPQRIGIKHIADEDRPRVEALVDAALRAFGLGSYTIAGLTKHSNVTAHLVSETAPPLALRLRTSPGADGRTEFAWLNAVRNGTDIRVVEPFADSYEANTRLVLDADGVPAECSLFRWSAGEPLASALNEENYFALGQMSSKLHEFALTWTPPSGLQPLVWNRTMYYEGTKLIIGAPEFAEFISRHDAQAVDAVVAAADAELERLERSADRRYLHGNIEMWNVLTTTPGQLCLLDFEDVMFGPPVLDIAVTLFYGRERTDYPALVAAYEAGYRSVGSWPVRDGQQMALLVAARAAMLLNYALQTESDKGSVTSRLLPLILAAA